MNTDYNLLPPEIIRLMLQRQVDQRNKRDITVFQKCLSAFKSNGGFDWAQTPEGVKFWAAIIYHKNFKPFYATYPAGKPVYADLVDAWPNELKETVLQYQEQAGNPRDINVFKVNIRDDVQSGGFAWIDSFEGRSFWESVLADGNIDRFMDLYNSKNKKIQPVDETLPRVVLVSTDNKYWKKRVLFFVKPGVTTPYICWTAAETLKDATHATATYAWEFMKEIPKTVSLSRKEIAEKFGIEIGQIEITD
jgi:hypothetical protein